MLFLCHLFLLFLPGEDHLLSLLLPISPAETCGDNGTYIIITVASFQNANWPQMLSSVRPSSPHQYFSLYSFIYLFICFISFSLIFSFFTYPALQLSIACCRLGGGVEKPMCCGKQYKNACPLAWGLGALMNL